MPEPTYRPLTGADRDELARFLGEHRWPFHVRERVGPAEAAEMVAAWDLDGGDSRAWWLELDGQVEAQTRRDNLAIRAVLRRCGYVKEAHYRRAWPDQHGTVHDGIGYALLRQDWERGTTTPVDWDGD